MEPVFLTCMAIAWFFSKAKIDSTAYANGKEPPGVAKARLRHERGGGARSAKTGRPKGHGAFRRMLAERWANSCEAAAQRANHKAARKRAWYDETAPHRDEAWRQKRLRKLENGDRRREQWAKARGLVSLDALRRRKADKAAEDEAWDKNQARDALAAGEPRDPYNPSDAAELLAFAKKNREIDRAAQEAATVPDGFDEATYYDYLRRRKADKAAEDERRSPRLTPDEATAQVEAARLTGTDRYVVQPRGENLDDGLWGVWDRERGEYVRDRDGVDLFDNEEDPRDLAREHQPSDLAELDAHTNPEGDSAASQVADEERMRDTADLELSTPATPNGAAGTRNTEPKGTPDVYEQAVQQLIRAADEVAEYRQQLANFADDLGGKQWGQEVWGPMADAASQLVEVEGTYRDLAGQVKAQGDAGASAYDQAPYVPGPQAVLG